MTAIDHRAGSLVRWDESDGVLTLTLTREDKLNAVNPEMLDVLRSATTAVAERDDLRVLVITAVGRYFTAGIDITTTNDQVGLTGSGPPSGVALRRAYRRVHLAFDELEALEKPVVLAAQGPCLGVGVELAVSCDFRLAAQRATFALPEIKTLAVIPGSGGISRLVRLVGPHWARWLAMAARPVDADRALVMGLVHEVYPDDDFPGAVHSFANELAGLSIEALGLAKLAINAAVTADRNSARDFDRVANTLLLLSAEHQDLRSRFLHGDEKDHGRLDSTDSR